MESCANTCKRLRSFQNALTIRSKFLFGKCYSSFLKIIDICTTFRRKIAVNQDKSKLGLKIFQILYQNSNWATGRQECPFFAFDPLLERKWSELFIFLSYMIFTSTYELVTHKRHMTWKFHFSAYCVHIKLCLVCANIFGCSLPQSTRPEFSNAVSRLF